ncbi:MULTISPECIES: Asp23/Gls24 family envelope stress response protein [Corynebacterium]|uniref:Alkaline shock protein 23 n=1 Tax=Corynebacterium pilosum TaxID=35756 RepID=A0A376CMU5_9CORY|nr:Asp23/Gls24 family envelope stress response protein [Corynebacterium pilosum]STC69615.1 Alkaline shock protein 23 [Corynebacterium pilosum]
MTSSTTPDTPTPKDPTPPREPNLNLVTEYGTTIIEDTVVGKIAGLAAREVSGVYNLGGGAARMVGAIRESLTASSNVQQGVTVEVVEGHVSVGVAIIAEYGVAIHELAQAIRQNIMTAITRMTGLIVDKVDVTVHDVHLPNLDDNGEDYKQVEQ